MGEHAERPTLLFVDNVCPRPYSSEDVYEPGLGGTEHSVVVLAKYLSLTCDVDCFVEQHNRLLNEKDPEAFVDYRPKNTVDKAKWVVVLRDPSCVPELRKRFPVAKIFLYCHDLPTHALGEAFAKGQMENIEAVVCVSQWHRDETVRVLKMYGYTGQVTVRAIHNPVVYRVRRTTDTATIDRNKLLWAASPHKGLSRAYSLLSELVKANKDFKLYVANPGYVDDVPPPKELEDSVVMLGSLPQQEVVEHMRSSLCLFYPNTVFPETFGKILAEANGVGTPVLTHPIGAVREILDTHPQQVINCFDVNAVVNRILEWHSGSRPIVRGNPRFEPSRVANDWWRLLNGIR